MTLVVAIGLGVAPLPRTLVERWYATGLYAALQPVLTSLTNRLPWALLDVLLVAAVVLAGVSLARDVRRRRRAGAAGSGRRWPGAVRVAAAVAAGYLVFLTCWGFNYRRQPVEARVQFDPALVTTVRVLALAEEATTAVNVLYAPAHAQPWPDRDLVPGGLGSALGRVADHLGLGWRPVPGRPKRTLLAPYFRWAGIAGLTNPFGLEVMPGPDTLPFERHAVLAHEWAHLAGFAHEAEAGFVGWLICLDSDDQARYSGWLEVWSPIVAALPREPRERMVAMLGEGPRRDLRAIAARNARAVPAVRDAAWRGYDAYLRSQHVSEGVASYQGVVRLMAGSARPPAGGSGAR